MLVCKQEFSQEIVSKIQAMVTDNPDISRRGLALQVCNWLNWKSPNGKFQEMSCRVALLKLGRRGIVKLPQPHSWGIDRAKRKCVSSYVLEVNPVSCTLDELGSVELIRINLPGSQDSQIWNVLMETYHYLGAGPLCGAQMRYLIKSSNYGWLGGLSFSAAAWRLTPRDHWIGWSDEARQQNLSRVVCNSRFLILPQIQVTNLASHVLSLTTGRLAKDWMKRYGLAPVLLETFVECERFAGTCYRAANWQYVGMTQGRGRQDRDKNKSLPVKDIYVYPLLKDAREVLCGTVFSKDVKCISRKETSPKDWPEEEFARVNLADRRLTSRLISIAADFYARPQASIPQACQSRAKTKATYRFLENPKITMDKVLHSHYEATLDRLRKEKVVLAIQDTTTLDYTTHPATENLGPIADRRHKTIGLLLHDTLAMNPEGMPLGLLDAQCWARTGEYLRKKRYAQLPIDQKESHKWLTSFQKTVQAQRRCPKTTFVSLADREADIYELFQLASSPASEGCSRKPELLVRAMHDRLLGADQGRLWERVFRQAVSGIQEVRIPRRGNRAARVAQLEVRFAQVSLKPPPHKFNLRDLNIWAVLAKEISPLEGVPPVEWLLLTTMEVTTFEQAVEKIAWYTVRWGIEVYHRTLKSGCKIEERQLGTADRIETCLAIDMVVAWRIVYLTRLGREIPDVPCTVYFEEAEWKALTAYITRNPVPSDKMPTLREATRMVASLGGFLGRKGDGEPGTESLWIGLQRLDDLTGMWKVMTNMNAPYPEKRILPGNPEYG